MKFWIISDTHFGHYNIMASCGRPPNYEALLLENLSKYVGSQDVLIHLGDFCLGDDAYYHEILHSICPTPFKWLVRGNHDRKSNTWYLEHGWSFVGDSITLDMFGKSFVLSHRPLKMNDGLNIHGHVHNREGWVDDAHHKLIMVEHEYRPYRLDKIVQTFGK